MIDDIVQMILKEARSREGKDLVEEIKEVRRIVDICLDQAISVFLQQQKYVDPTVKPSHQWRWKKSL